MQVSDLYAMGWQPVSDRRNFTTAADPQYYKQQQEELYATEHNGFSPDVQAELEKLVWCDVLLFQFPLWWFSMPSILKGWVDRVFAMGTVYGRGRWYDDGVFQGKRAMLSLTTGGAETAYSATGLNGNIEAILYPINHGILRFTGFDVLPQFITWSVARVSAEERADFLERYRGRLLSLQATPPLSYPGLSEFDPETLRLKTP